MGHVRLSVSGVPDGINERSGRMDIEIETSDSPKQILVQSYLQLRGADPCRWDASIVKVHFRSSNKIGALDRNGCRRRAFRQNVWRDAQNPGRTDSNLIWP